MLKVNAGLINILKKTVRNENIPTPYFFIQINSITMKGGYIVEPSACSEETLEWAKRYVAFNPNSTFYKNWGEIERLSQTELLLNELYHYISTYGTNFTCGKGFTYNNVPVEIDYTSYNILKAVDDEEIFNDAYGMIKSGIALSSSTVETIANFIDENNLYNKIDVDEISNKEIIPTLCVKGKILPKDEFNLLRMFMYCFADSAMLIKDRKTIEKIKSNVHTCNSYKSEFSPILDIIGKLDNYRKERLSRIFYRYKPLFLALKCEKTSKAINQIRRLAKKNHTPLKVGFWEKVLSPIKTRQEKMERLQYTKEHSSEISIYKRVSLIGAIVERISLYDTIGASHKRMFRIRNGKAYITDNKTMFYDKDFYLKISHNLLNSIVVDLKNKYQKEDGTMPTIRLPKNINLVVPISEKNFIGDIPSGSYVDLNDTDNIVGIYWKNEWGARDLDLHFDTFDGTRYGWNSNLKGEGVFFSGDMTNADPEAAELYKFDIGNDGVFTVQEYSGNDTYEFRFFVAKDDFDNIKELSNRGYRSHKCMVDPNKILYSTQLKDDLGGTQIAIVNNKRLIFTKDSLGGNRIPDAELLHDGMENLILKSISRSVPIRKIIESCGFKIVEDDTTEVDFDFTVITRNELIDFFAV